MTESEKHTPDKGEVFTRWLIDGGDIQKIFAGWGYADLQSLYLQARRFFPGGHAPRNMESRLNHLGRVLDGAERRARDRLIGNLNTMGATPDILITTRSKVGESVSKETEEAHFQRLLKKAKRAKT